MVVNVQNRSNPKTLPRLAPASISPESEWKCPGDDVRLAYWRSLAQRYQRAFHQLIVVSGCMIFALLLVCTWLLNR